LRRYFSSFAEVVSIFKDGMGVGSTKAKGVD
jgi:hypothetical protein